MSASSTNIRIRLATPQDAAALVSIKAPYVQDTAYNFAWAPPTEKEFAAEVRQVLERYPFLVAESVPSESAVATTPAAGTSDETADDTKGEAAHADMLPRIIGYAQAEPVRHRESDQWAVELTIYLARAARGHGVGTLLYQRLLDLLRKQGVLDAYACITAENTVSIAFHERMGFEEVGRFPHAGFKLGAWHDTVWMHKSLGEHRCPPQPFTPFAELEA